MPLLTSRKQQQNLKVSFEDDMLLVELPNGKQQAFPLAFSPGLRTAAEEERNNWVQVGNSLYWPKLGITINI